MLWFDQIDFRCQLKDGSTKAILLSMSLLTLSIKLSRYTKLFTFSLCSPWIKMLSANRVRTMHLSKYIFIPRFMQACYSS